MQDVNQYFLPPESAFFLHDGMFWIKYVLSV